MKSSSSTHGEWKFVSPLSMVFFFGKFLSKLPNWFFQHSHFPLVMMSLVVAMSIYLKMYWLWVFILGALIFVVLIGLFLAALFTFYRFRFKVSDEEIAVREGVFRVVQTDVPWSRIRAVNIRRNAIERITNLATISIDTAGTATAEILIPTITNELANALRSKTGGKVEGVLEQTTETALSEAIYRMTTKDLLLASACSSGAIWIVIVGLALMLVFLFSALVSGLNMDPTFQPRGLNAVSYFEEALPRIFEQFQSGYLACINWIESTIGITLTGSWNTLLIGTLGLFAFAVIVCYFGTFLFCFTSNFNLQVRQTDENMSISRGFFTTRYSSLAPQKIQILSLRMNFRELLFGIGELTAQQSASGRDHRLVIPSSPTHVRHKVTGTALGNTTSSLKLDPRANEFIQISPIYLVQLLVEHVIFVVIGMVCTYGILVLSGNSLDPVMWWLLWLPCSLPIAMLQWRKAAYAYDSDVLVSRRGLLGYRLSMGRIGKVQFVSIKQNAIQRLTGKSTLTLHFATGNIVFPYMQFTVARRLTNYVLNFVESKEKHWQ